MIRENVAISQMSEVIEKKRELRKNNLENPNSKSDRILQGVDVWCSFYRANPHRFAKDFLNLDLKIFQQIILNLMFISTNLIFFACRSLGKTFLISIFATIKCILYPNSQVVVVSKTRSQGNEVLEKIEKILMPNSQLLRNEIDLKKTIISGQKAQVMFKNGSYISVSTMNDNARHSRATVLIIDEFVKTDNDLINNVHRKFLVPRNVRFKSKPQYKNYVEREQMFYLSSCWLKNHWSYELAKGYCVNLVDDKKKYFICGLPYQIAIKENLLYREKVLDEMSESTFNEISFMMEMECLFFGESENAFFKYDDLLKTRRIDNPLYTYEDYSMLSDKIIKYYHKTKGEIRLVCVDIATMSSSKNKNDATALFVLQLLPTDNGQYVRNVIYLDTFEGVNTKIQAIKIRKLFDDLECDYIVLDTNGVGMGVYDNLVDDLVDNESGKVYPALQCCNDNEMAKHYKGKDVYPRKVIYSIKATANFNSQCAFSLRDVISRGKLRLLESEKEFETRMSTNKAYKDLSLDQKQVVRMPYIQTTLLINELINLEYVAQGNNVKIKEQSDRRKDRYSALSYGNQIANDLELKLKKPNSVIDMFKFKMRPPSTLKRK